MNWNRWFVLALAFTLLPALELFGAQNWDDPDFANMNKCIRESADETWLTIPWKMDLLDAQRTSVAESKPIFIWAMDGHPLGCT